LSDVIVIDDSEEYADVEKELIFLGPLAFEKKCLKRILRAAKAYSRPPSEKEAGFILLGSIRQIDGTPVFIVEDQVQLCGMVTPLQVSFDLSDIKKIIEEAEKDHLTIVGVLHTHPRGDAEPSLHDKISWLILQSEIGRAVPLLIYSLNNDKIGMLYIEWQLIDQLIQRLKTRKMSIERIFQKHDLR